MKITTKCLLSLLLSVLCLCNANATPCPPGCFCLNNGAYTPSPNIFPNIICNTKGQRLVTCAYDKIFFGGIITCDHNGGATYFFDQFSDLYEATSSGWYGIIDNEMVYIPLDYTTQSMFGCPASHPHSDSGAKSVIDCYKYDTNGNKKYFKIKQSITCAAGQYLPANATQCVSCSTSQHHVCPGGSFEKMDKIQGLKVECYPGQYLPANATQCSPCNTNFYLCPGSVYNAGEATDQGRISNSGYFSGENHNFISCQPGYCVPPAANQCVKCTNVNSPNHACPGGMFYVDVPYQFARGRVLCAYGHPNNNHTECVATSTSPSFMLEKVSEAIAAQQNQPEMSTGGEQLSQPQTTIKSTKKGNQRLSTSKTGQHAQLSHVVQLNQTTNITESEPETTEQQQKLNLTKKVISAGLAVPVTQDQK